MSAPFWGVAGTPPGRLPPARRRRPQVPLRRRRRRGFEHSSRRGWFPTLGTAAAKQYDSDSKEELGYEAHALKISMKIETWTYRALALVAVPGTGAREPATRQAQQAKRQKET